MKIGFTHGNGIFARLIRKFTNSNWSHCYIVLDQTFNEDPLIFEASFKGGVKLNFLSNKELGPLFEIRGTPTLEPFYRYFGKNYGYLQILGFVVAKVFGLKKNPIKGDVVCSEVVFRFLTENGFKEFDHLDPNSATPEDIFQIVSTSRNFKPLNS